MFVDHEGNRWFQGNLHTHTTRSDGRRTPEEAARLYREAGYDFLALTDHWKPSEGGRDGGLLLLPGVEYDVGRSAREGIWHIVGIGMERDPHLEREPSLTAQKLIDTINGADGLAILAHPAWSLDRASDAAGLMGLAGAEIYNTTSGTPWNARPYSGAFLDELALRGVCLPCMAADDAHWYDGDETRSYLMVRAAECTPAALLSAIRRGDFYASQGPRFSWECVDGMVRVHCSPVRQVVFFSDTVFTPDRVTQGEAVTEAACRIQPTDHFLRFELTDADGNQAWSSFLPIH